MFWSFGVCTAVLGSVGKDRAKGWLQQMALNFASPRRQPGMKCIAALRRCKFTWLFRSAQASDFQIRRGI